MQLESNVNVLLVDDHPENLVALEAILGGLGQNLVKANSGPEALRCLLHQDFAVILLDVQMPDMDGFETAMLIRQRERSRDTPIIFVTAFNTSDDWIVKGYSLGAVDYLFKPINPAILTSKVTVFVDLFKKTLEVKQQASQLAAVNLELRQSEERFRLLSRCSPIGIFLMDTTGGYTYANPSCQEICGFTVQENWKSDWTNYIHPEDQQKVLMDWSVAIQQGQAYSDEFRILADQRLKWVHVRTSPMLSDYGDLLGHVGTIEEVTDRKQADETREQIIQEQAARQQAETANRMKDEFLAIVSHELRTPLNSILGWSQILLQRQLDEMTMKRALQTIERNARSQAQLIEDILDVSQIIRGKLRLSLQPLHLIALVEAVMETVRPTASNKSIQLEAVFESNLDLDKVYGDSERLRQIIWNLLSNAIKFTPEQGRVIVKLTRAHYQDRQNSPIYQLSKQYQSANETKEAFTQQCFNPYEYAQLQIIDTGIGIEAKFLPHVFDRFRQADSTTTRPYGGLGLGLAIVRHLVEQHYGTIHADSHGSNQGATFTVNLPLLRTEPTVQTEINLLTSSVNQRNTNQRNICLEQVHILLVEDHQDTRDFLQLILQESGAKVTAVASVNEALEALPQIKPQVIVSDIGMPIEDGYNLIRTIRNRETDQDQHIPAIALTAYAREADQCRALEAGFEMHVSKPVEPQELVAAVAKVMGRSISRKS